MPFLQATRLLLAVRRLIAKHRNALLIPCCVAVVALAARQLDIRPLNSTQLSQINRAIYHPMNTSETDCQISFGSKSHNGKVPGKGNSADMSPMQGWFVLPESLFEKSQKLSGEMLEVSGDNKSVGVDWFEKLHQGLQLCGEDLRSEVGGPKESAPGDIISRLLFARETVDCLLQEAAAPGDGEFELCPGLNHPDLKLLHGYKDIPSKNERLPRGKDRGLDDCPPCAWPRDGDEMGKRAQDLIDNQLPTQKGQDLIPSRYFIRQGKGRSRKNIFWKSHECEHILCGERDLSKDCSKDPTKLGSAMRSTCRMCYPVRDEIAIEEHCTKRRRREMGVLYILCAILITVIVSAAFLVFLRGHRSRNQEPDREASRDRLRKGWSLPLVTLPTLGWKMSWATRRFWQPGFLQSLSRHKAQLDVEGDPAWFDANAYVRKQDEQSPWNYPEEMQPLPRAFNKFRGATDTLSLRKVAGHHPVIVEDKVPVMPPARSSSVQLSPASDAVSRGTLRNVRNGSGAVRQNQQFATVHARSPTVRVTLDREMSRTLQ